MAELATQPGFVLKINSNRIELDSWILRQPAPDGGWALIGMCRRTEYDAKTGAVIAINVEPTGLRGWAPSRDEQTVAPLTPHPLLARVIRGLGW